ncbi:MAG: hypothetical protein ACYDIB_01100 [Desulfobulbia bacterium]
METGYPNQGGWFNDRSPSTGAPSKLSSIVLAASLLVSTGTGAFAHNISRLQQQHSNASSISNPVKIYAVEVISERTTTENMKRIRDVLSPAMSDLAKSFNVSRQTIYNWLNGEQPTSGHTARLKDLALAADMFNEAGILANGTLLKRKVVEGKNLFEIVHEGGSARDAAQLLLQIVRRETNQRERLATRFAGRTVSQYSADSDIMAADDKA